MVSNCLKSRREGLSPLSNKYYEGYLSHSNQILGLQITGQDITQFLKNLSHRNGGKHAYFMVLRAFYNWIYSPKSGYNLAPQDNPILTVESPKVGKRILPSLTLEPLDLVIDNAECDRGKAIISLSADSGLRLSELANLDRHNIDWQNHLITVICKGDKEGHALFGSRTEKLLSEWITQYPASDKLWDIRVWGISWMLRKLEGKTGLPCLVGFTHSIRTRRLVDTSGAGNV